MSSITQSWPVYFNEMLHTVDVNNHIGIVTLWAKKEIYIDKIDSTLYNTIGQLYSREEGLSGLVRNLLANKQITDLVMLGTDLNHCSDALLDFFEKGVDSENKVICKHESKLDKEIPKESIDKLRESVTLHDFRHIKDYVELNKVISNIEKKPFYGEFETFKEAQIVTPDFYPSDMSSFKVSGKTVGDTWLKILKTIEKFGYVKKSQYGDDQKEIISLVSVVTDEDPDNIKWYDFFEFSKQELADYIPQVTTPSLVEGLDYTYGQKLMNFRNIDQVKQMIEQLKKENFTRRAVACTWDVLKDCNNPKAPCLDLIQALVQGDKLYFTCYFRSNDMYGAWPRNAFALRKLQKNICEEIGVKMGPLIVISNSAHYYERAYNKVSEILEKNKNRISWDSDPNGAIIISLAGGKIVVQHVGPNGERLDKIEGGSAMELYKIIGDEKKVSNISHAMDIGCELQKAEIALKQGLEYIQDRPLKFN